MVFIKSLSVGQLNNGGCCSSLNQVITNLSFFKCSQDKLLQRPIRAGMHIVKYIMGTCRSSSSSFQSPTLLCVRKRCCFCDDWKVLLVLVHEVNMINIAKMSHKENKENTDSVGQIKSIYYSTSQTFHLQNRRLRP